MASASAAGFLCLPHGDRLWNRNDYGRLIILKDSLRNSTPWNHALMGLSFRTTEEGLRNAFKKFGEIVEVNLVMDSIARRPRDLLSFVDRPTEEESQRAIEGMHGKGDTHRSCETSSKAIDYL